MNSPFHNGPAVDSHLPRKFLHALGGLVVPVAYWWEPVERELIVDAVGAAAACWGVFDLWRLRHPWTAHRFGRHFAFLMKEREARQLTGTTFLLAGSFLALLLFTPEVAILSLLFLALGDPSAAVIGKRYGSIPVGRGRTLEGSAAMAVVCVAVAAASGWVGMMAAVGGGGRPRRWPRRSPGRWTTTWRCRSFRGGR